MNKNSLTIVILTSLMFITNIMFSQSNNWEEYYNDNQIKIEYNYIICDFSSTASQEVVVLKFTNLFSGDVTITYDTKLWHNDKEIDTEQKPEEFRKNIRLKANETIITNCDNKMDYHAIFSAFIDNKTNEKYVTLTNFELTNITIKYE